MNNNFRYRMVEANVFIVGDLSVPYHSSIDRGNHQPWCRVWGSMITATMLVYSFTTLISFKQQLSVGHKGDEPILYHGLVV